MSFTTSPAGAIVQGSRHVAADRLSFLADNEMAFT